MWEMARAHMTEPSWAKESVLAKGLMHAKAKGPRAQHLAQESARASVQSLAQTLERGSGNPSPLAAAIDAGMQGAWWMQVDPAPCFGGSTGQYSSG